MTMRRAGYLTAALAGLVLLASCGKAPEKAAAASDVINFSILSAENQQSSEKLWQPLLDDMAKETGLKVKPYFASNYMSLITAMQFKQVQMGWFSALPALEAIQRADGQILGRITRAEGGDTYYSVLIVKKGSGITLDKVLACGKRYSFGLGDPSSTSGTLAPMAYLFTPKGIDPSACFSTVRSAQHQQNLFAVANGVEDIATGNSVGLVFAARDNPQAAAKVETIWRSPDLPESSIVVRKDLDPAVQAKLRKFFFAYGSAPGAEGDRQRAILKRLDYGGIREAGAGYLDPVRLMQASQTLAEAKTKGDAKAIATAQAAFDAVQKTAAANVAAEKAAAPAS
jgi:phosphonate transport system substrate-binding protein